MVACSYGRMEFGLWQAGAHIHNYSEAGIESEGAVSAGPGDGVEEQVRRTDPVEHRHWVVEV